MTKTKLWRALYGVFLAGLAMAVLVAAVVASTYEPEIKAFTRDDYPQDDSVSKGLTPNVLFFLDSSSSMLFDPRGVMPHVDDGRSDADRAELLAYCTWGTGARNMSVVDNIYEDVASLRLPVFEYERMIDGRFLGVTQFMGSPLSIFDTDAVATSNDSQLRDYSRFGRDINANNNRIGDTDCYYTPFKNRPHFLTFKNRILAWGMSGDAMPGRPAGVSDDEWEAAENSHAAILPYILDKKPVPRDLANMHLVPNDSKVYMMKLALWRITENEEMLSKVNIGVAKNYQEFYATPGGYGGTVPIRGWAMSESPGRTGKYAAPRERNYFTSNTLSPQGIGTTHFYNANQNVYFAVNDINGNTLRPRGQQAVAPIVKTGYYHTPPDSFDDLWRSYSRAILQVPFDRLYVKDGIGFRPTGNLGRLREFIDGIERWENRTTAADTASKFPIQDELLPVGLGYLASAIYGGRAGDPDHPDLNPYAPDPYSGVDTAIYHSGQKYHGSGDVKPWLIQYGTTDRYIEYDINSDGYTAGIRLTSYDNSEGLHSGMAAGSVIDFFSPLPDSGNADGLAFDGNEGFFPVAGSCQQNWLVLFVSGLDPIPKYKNHEAVKKLFMNTLRMRGRREKADGTWEEAIISMDSGVRTLVVGFVDDTIGDREIRDIVSGLNETARWGDPIYSESQGEWIKNPDAKPYLVKNVNDMVKAMDDILKRITVGNMGAGSPVGMADTEAEVSGDVRVLLGAAYKMSSSNQWNGWLQRIDITCGDVQIEHKTIWEADHEMAREASTAAGRTKLYTFTTNVTNATKVTEVNLQSHGGIVDIASADAFSKWLHNFDVKNPPEDGSIGVLGDMQRSNIVVVSKPKANSIPDKTRPHRVYVQTNRGVLHALDYKDGEEKWAFIPPNIFEGRLKYLKFKDGVSGLEWLEGARSTPMLLLDGKLIAQDVRIDGTYKTIMTGYLGRGGNGFYTMDVTSAPDDPKFMWAVENRYYGTGAPATHDNVTVWGEAKTLQHDYSQLGLTIAPGIFLSPDGERGMDIGVLPGGLGHKMGADEQGKMFYFFKPADGRIIKTLSQINGTSDPLGMGVTPIVYEQGAFIADTGGKMSHAVGFYTADHLGNILSCDLTKQQSDWALGRMFKLRTVAEAGVSAGLPIVMPYAMEFAQSVRADKWLFGGTADIMGPGSASSDDMKIINKQQFIFGLNMSRLPADAEMSNVPPEYHLYSGNSYTFNPDAIEKLDNSSWYMRLRPELPADTADKLPTEPEYVSARPYMFGGYLFVATFAPYKGANNQKTCENIGIGRLYVLSPSVGLSYLRIGSVYMENVKIVGFGGSGTRLSMGVQELQAGSVSEAVKRMVNDTRRQDGESEKILELKDPKEYSDIGIVEITAGALPASVPNIPVNMPHIQYWREKFN